MKRISPVLVLLLAAGCANAGISDWLNPFRMFGGKPQASNTGSAAAGVQHSPKSVGHRGTRQLGYGASAPSHGPGGPLGSPAGHLDDGFKPSFPPGFSSPPSHSPSLNPFAVGGDQGPSGVHTRGPLYPNQLTAQNTPHIHASPLRPRGRFGFRSRAPPPHHHHQHSSASALGGQVEESPNGGAPGDFNDYSRIVPGGPNGIEFEGDSQGHPQGPPQGHPQAHPQAHPQGHGPFGGAPARGPPPGFHHRPGGRPHGRPGGPPPSFNPQSGRPGGHGPHFGRPHHGGPGGPSESGPFNIEGNEGPQVPFGNSRPLGPPGPGALSGPPGGRPGSDAPFFAPSPGAFRPGQDSRSPFAGAPQSPPQFGQGPTEGSFFGSENAPQGPQDESNGPQSFFGVNSNDYPEQFEGGNRDTRQPQLPLGQVDFRPQPNGPPDGTNGSPDEQNAGFYGALHDTNNAPQLGSPNFFSGQPENSPSLDSSGGNSPFLNPNIHAGGPPQGQSIFGSGAPVREESPAYAPAPRQRKAPARLGIRNTLAAAFQGSSSNLPAYGAPLMMSASGGKPALISVPKVARSLRPFVRKPGVILPLSSPKDPNYRPLLLSPSNMSPVTAAFEPDTAASGHHGGHGGLSHNGDRILYHVAGERGDYRFGFDTGAGHNRIFRFEEKDGNGFVKGKYGFYDKHGKLNIINYQAHPKHGYHAERGHSHGLY